MILMVVCVLFMVTFAVLVFARCACVGDKSDRSGTSDYA
jgi:hypothetical protein